MSVIISYQQYKNYGSCAVLTSPGAELYATLDVGPRIIRYAPKGGENFFKEDLDRVIFKSNEKMDKAYYPGAKWYIYGGHRLWLSPEYMPETYYPDNEPVGCRETESGVILKPPAQKHNLVQLEIEITMSDSGDVKVVHRCTNLSQAKKRFALWGLTAMAPGGIQIFRQPDKQTGYLPNRSLVLWPYADLTDKRLGLGKRFITLKQDISATSPIKLGMSGVTAAAYANGTDMFIKRFDWDENAAYPDFGVNYETYTNAAFLELETLSPLFDAESGQTVRHIEHWSIGRDINPNALDFGEKIEKLLK